MKELYQIERINYNYCLVAVEKTFAGKGILASPNLDNNTVTVDSPLSEKDWKQIHFLLSEEGYELREKI
ncbi:copper-binding protein [Leptospira ilyithenensis]|uniref:Copper-binding protein n=1 Tax=Leptospira ilyithenensis TaxID=2484901 RepID=A0A4R9LY23_9LEPT|nr:copper-binding protein [Leptospira ilyithenensis]TGN14671.1 copper-binding protein [Leptospira ilyithenensis]